MGYEKYGHPIVSAIDIDERGNSRKKVPEDRGEPFVLRHYVLTKTSDVEEIVLIIVAMTGRLLANLQKSGSN